MEVKFLKSWRQYKVGQLLNPPDGAGNMLISRGIVEVVKPPGPKPKRKKNT